MEKELKDILVEIKDDIKDLKEGQKSINTKLYVIEKRVDTLNNKLDIVIKVNELRQSTAI
jgi:hypothetical protein